MKGGWRLGLQNAVTYDTADFFGALGSFWLTFKSLKKMKFGVVYEFDEWHHFELIPSDYQIVKSNNVNDLIILNSQFSILNWHDDTPGLKKVEENFPSYANAQNL